MAGEWAVATLSEVAEKIAMGPFGSSIKVETFVPSGIPVISGQHLHGSRLDERAGFNFIALDHAKRLDRANVQRGDVIFTHAGNIGQVAYIPENSEHERYVISQRQFYMRCNRDRVLPEFVVYYFKSPEGRHKLLANASQVGVPSIAQPVSYLRTIEIPVPPVPEQRAIAHILGTLDNKIELNRQMNELIDELVLTELQRRFWKSEDALNTVPLSELMELKREPVDPRLYPNETFDHYSLPAYDDGKVPLRQRGEGIRSAKFGIPDGAVLVSKLNPTIRRVWLPLPASPSVRRIASTEFMVLTPKLPVSSAFLYTLWRSDPVRRQLTARVTGTSGSHQRVRPEDVLGSTVAMPSEVTLALFGEFATPLYQRYIANLQQSEVLAALRDALLPRLVSGEIRLGRGGRAEVAPAAP